jgi:RNA polymerase sigma factor (sigma-70 family)
LSTQVVAISSLCNCTENIGSIFWQLWEQYRDDLYRYCLKWMGGNPTNAEDALSRAMLKAWEKMQRYTGEIANFKAWLTRLTYNLCVDIHRECDAYGGLRLRRAKRVENIEVYASVEDQRLVTLDDTPEIAMETSEKKIIIRSAIANLPIRIRETFILHFYQELSHQEIAQQQNISYQNVCKRISQARANLREELREYFIGEDKADKDLSLNAVCNFLSNLTPNPFPTREGEQYSKPLSASGRGLERGFKDKLHIASPTSTLAAIGEISQKNTRVELIVGEKLTSSVAVGEVEIVVGEEPQEIVQSVQHSDSESVLVAAIFNGKLEVKRDSHRCVEAMWFKLLPATILALAKFDQETESSGNSCLVVQRLEENPEMGKGSGVFLLPFRSPPTDNAFYFKFLSSILDNRQGLFLSS